MQRDQGADAFQMAEGSTAGGVFASRRWALRGRRSQARTTSSMRENQEIPWLPVGVDDAPSWMVHGVADRCLAGREGNANGGNPLMHDHGKSDRLVVPTKPPNNAAQAGAEAGELVWI